MAIFGFSVYICIYYMYMYDPVYFVLLPLIIYDLTMPKLPLISPRMTGNEFPNFAKLVPRWS